MSMKSEYDADFNVARGLKLSTVIRLVHTSDASASKYMCELP